MYKFFVTIILLLLAVSPVFGIEGRSNLFSYALYYFGGDGPATLNMASTSSLVLESLGSKDGVSAVLARRIIIAPEPLGNRLNYNWYPSSGYQYQVMLRFAKDNGEDPIYVTVPAELVYYGSSGSYSSPIIGCSGYVKFNYNYPSFPGDPDPPGGDGGGDGGGDPPGTGDPDPPGGGGDPPGTGDPDPPGTGDPDPPGGDCECGACCSDKCTCGKWSTALCSGVCYHNAENGNGNPAYCECHHEDDDDDEECCEHHQPIQDATERTADAAERTAKATESIDEKLDLVNPGELIMPSITFSGPVAGAPPRPSIFIPDIEGLPEFEEHSKPPLTYFERGDGDWDLPTFKYEQMLSRLKSKVDAKFGIGDISDKFGDPSAGNFPLQFTVDFTLPEPFNAHVGPHTFNLNDQIDWYCGLSANGFNISNVVRLILLGYVGVMFSLAVFHRVV